MRKSILKKRLKRVARFHAWLSGGLMALYIGLSIVYSPEFLFSDVRDKFQAFADDVIIVTAHVLAPPVKPVVAAIPACDSGSGRNLSVSLDWGDDENSVSYDISRDGLPLVAGLLTSEYSDTAVSVGASYSYEVTAHGPMGPGFAVSDPIAVEMPERCSAPFIPELSIASFDGKAIGRFSGTPRLTNRRPEFSGVVNIPNANMELSIHSSLVISAVTTANENGYWIWRPPVDISYGDHTIFVTATDPDDSLVTVSKSFPFIITKKDDDDGGKKKRTDVVVSVPSSISDVSSSAVAEPEVVETGVFSPEMPFGIDLSMLADKAYQGRSLPFSIEFSDVTEAFSGVGATARYAVLDSDGRERFSFSENVVIADGEVIPNTIAIPAYFKDGQYRFRAEIITDRYDVSREKEFLVLPLPILSPGGGVVITYAGLLSRLGSLALCVFLLLLLWIFVFSREYMLYLRAFRHITERHLARAGFFGKGSGLST